MVIEVSRKIKNPVSRQGALLMDVCSRASPWHGGAVSSLRRTMRRPRPSFREFMPAIPLDAGLRDCDPALVPREEKDVVAGTLRIDDR